MLTVKWKGIFNAEKSNPCKKGCKIGTCVSVCGNKLNRFLQDDWILGKFSSHIVGLVIWPHGGPTRALLWQNPISKDLLCEFLFYGIMIFHFGNNLNTLTTTIYSWIFEFQAETWNNRDPKFPIMKGATFWHFCIKYTNPKIKT